MIGPTAQVVHTYLSENAQQELSWSPRHPSKREFEYHRIAVERSDTHAAAEAVPADAPIDVVFDFSVTSPLSDGRIELRLADEYGDLLLTSTSADADQRRSHAWSVGRHRFTCHIPPHLLAPGTYRISVTHPFGGYDVLQENILAFQVTEQNSLMAIDGRGGKIAPRLEWTRG
jgi:hypothetical protein